MPLSLAVLSPNAADDAIAAHPEIERWVLVGHSLGGAMGASYADEHASEIGGLALLAAYPIERVDLRDSDLEVANVLGTLDTVVDEANWKSGAARLPEDAETVIIDGGNHAQFGDYGEQPGDTAATITAPEQLKWTVGAILRVIEKVER